jgi:hypothetical protein
MGSVFTVCHVSIVDFSRMIIGDMTKYEALRYEQEDQWSVEAQVEVVV